MLALKQYFKKANFLFAKYFTTIIPNFINGEFQHVASPRKTYPVVSPLTQEVLYHVPQTSREEMHEAARYAQEAFEKWKNVPILIRQRYLFDLQKIIKDNEEEIAKVLCKEHGKTLPDARGEVYRSYELVELGCAVATIMMGETSMNIAKGIDTISILEPLGVTGCVSPFNFPFMCPMWSIPNAIGTGNTIIVKPSTRDPGAMQLLGKYLQQINLPKGVIQIVNGGEQSMMDLIEAPYMKAISFVGGNKAGEKLHIECAKRGIRSQCNMAAKNHAVVMPDANPEDAVNNLISSAFGATGQRCMAISVAVLVGDAKKIIPMLIEKSSKVKVGAGDEPDVEVAPLSYRDLYNRVLNYIESVPKEGGTILLDGRNFKHPKYPNGNFIAPTIVEVNENMTAYKDEIFGPVLCVIYVDTLDEAIKLINRNHWGNGTAIFTKSGAAARKFQMNIEATQVGINIPIPVPVPMFSFTGGKDSFRGDLHTYGKEGVRFFTQQKTIMSRWKEDDEAISKLSMVFPTSKSWA